MKQSNHKFYAWLAGVMDGDGNFDFTNETLKSVRIKIQVRDVRILTRIQNGLGCGRIRHHKNKSYVTYILTLKKNMTAFVNHINGLIRVKVPSFKRACAALNVNYIAANPVLQPYDAYFAGLVDTDGSVVFNYPDNRIEVNVKINTSPSVEAMNLDNLIPGLRPNIVRCKTGSGKISHIFKFQSVSGMNLVYDYFMVNRLYSDMKFYRVSKIKRFIELRRYQQSPVNSVEFKIYSAFLINFITYQNPYWTKEMWVKKLDKDIVHKSTQN